MRTDLRAGRVHDGLFGGPATVEHSSQRGPTATGDGANLSVWFWIAIPIFLIAALYGFVSWFLGGLAGRGWGFGGGGDDGDGGGGGGE